MPGKRLNSGGRRAALEVQSLSVRLSDGGQRQIIRSLDLKVHAGETFGLMGPSGCGKSTLLRVLAGLNKQWTGYIRLLDRSLSPGRRFEPDLRRAVQMVFQDPYASLHPLHTVERTLREPLRINGVSASESRIRQALDEVRLAPELARRYPHELSGGQRQRVAIARAIALKPRFILADEAVSALDVSVRAQIVNLLQEFKEQLGLTYLFIGHGLGLMRHISDRIGVMYLGRMVEIGPADALFRNPAHPYTRGLIDAIPSIDPTLAQTATIIEGEIPSPVNPPSGCRFHTRCPIATARCREDDPALTAYDTDRAVACHYPL
jgi:peptide/nickel transport system ATP-binding protein